MRKLSILPTLKSACGTAVTVVLALGVTVLFPSFTESAVANGDTRTISLVHAHTNETITATFRVNGSYDGAVLQKLNWFLRDWRRDEPTKMDPRLFDLVWETYQQSGSQQPIKVMSAYRSPQTNAMLRRRSRAVAEYSQHILGKAMDQHYQDVPVSRIREIGLRLQRGGVGYYPTAGSPFVHLDVGSIRHWPRMTYEQLSRVFPDGKTVHVPSNGQPLPRYEEARAEIERNGSAEVPVSSVGKSTSFFAALFGGGGEDEDTGASVRPGRGRRGLAPVQVASNGPVPDNSTSLNSNNFFLAEQRGTSPVVDQSRVKTARLSQRRGAKPVAEPPAPAPAIQVAAATPDPAVLAAAKPRALPPVPKNVPEPDAPREIVVAEAAPLPPRRPAALASLLFAGNVPLPPTRPAEIGAQTASQAKPDPLGKLIIASRSDPNVTTGQPALPDVILRGPGDNATKPQPVPALSYAATDDTTASVRPLVGVRSAATVRLSAVKAIVSGAKPDRLTLRDLTNSAPAERAQPQTAIGAAAPPLRSGLRMQAPSLFAQPVLGTATRFDQSATNLPTDHFLLQ